MRKTGLASLDVILPAACALACMERAEVTGLNRR
jgi:hypothetical protein